MLSFLNRRAMAMAEEAPKSESKEAPATEERVLVSDEDVRASFAGPAFHSNKVYLSMTAAGARIAFMEQLGDKVAPVYRTAVILSYADALALRDLITRQLRQIEVAIKSAEPEATKQDGD